MPKMNNDWTVALAALILMGAFSVMILRGFPVVETIIAVGLVFLLFGILRIAVIGYLYKSGRLAMPVHPDDVKALEQS